MMTEIRKELIIILIFNKLKIGHETTNKNLNNIKKIKEALNLYIQLIKITRNQPDSYTNAYIDALSNNYFVDEIICQLAIGFLEAN